MNLHSQLSRDNFHHSVQIHFFSAPCKLSNLPSPVNPNVFLGFSSSNCSISKPDYSSNSLSPSLKPDLGFSSSPREQNPRRPLGFKLYCHSKPVALPAKRKNTSFKKKSYGGILPSILRSLNSSEDIEKTLSLHHGNLSPKEQTVILKEQRSWERVIRVFEWMKSQEDYLPNIFHYNVVLQIVGRAQKWDELRLCWIDMAKRGVVPTNNTYAILIDLYGKSGLAKEAVLWVKHMKIRGIFPDEVTMNTVVRVLKDAKEYDKADKFYKDWCVGRIDLDSSVCSESDKSEPMSLKHFLSTELFRTGGRNISSDPEGSIQKPILTATYNTLIDLYGKAGRLKDAAEVFAEMLKSGIKVDTFTFNTMIFTCGSHGQLSEAEALLVKMEERRILPDTKTYNIFLSLYADVGRIDKAVWCYKKIEEAGLYPDSVTYRAILHVLCERKMVQEVEGIIQDMEKFGKHVDKQSIPVIIKMFVEEGFVDRAKSLFEKRILDGGLPSKIHAAIIDVYAENELWAEAENVFLCQKYPIGQKKDIVEYNVMIKAYGKAKLHEKAFTLFKTMRNNGIWPDDCTYNSLVQMFARADLIDQSRQLLNEMRESGIKPSCLTFSSVIASYIRSNRLSDAVNTYHDMTKSGVEPNHTVFGSLIDGFAENGDFQEANQYFHIMEEEFKIPANLVVLTSLIKAHTKIGSVEGAKLIYEKMKTFDSGPDIIASNSMINLYAETGMIEEARILFNDLKEKGVADGVSFATMMYLYKNMGMLDEALQVAEEMRKSELLTDSVTYNKVMACYATNNQLIASAEMLYDMIRKKIPLDNGTFKVLFTVMKKGGVASDAVSQLEYFFQERKRFSRQAIVAAAFAVVGFRMFALDICDRFVKNDMGLDSCPYNVAIYVYGRFGKVDEALNVFMRMQDRGIEADIVTYIHLVTVYGRAGMFEGVKRVYGLMKYGDIEKNESLYKAVIDAYKTANRNDRAALVSVEMKLALGSSNCETEQSLFESDDDYDNVDDEEEDDDDDDVDYADNDDDESYLGL